MIEKLSDDSVEVRTMAAFALGEIESAKAADAILNVLKDPATAEVVRARAVEAAGKIAAANPRHEKFKPLGDAIVTVLDTENRRITGQNRDVILLGVTAVLRARPTDGDIAVAKFLTNSDERIRADAANTLSRLRSKNANAALRTMLLNDHDGNARANAARALGAAEDKEAFAILLDAATKDTDSRVRVSAIRSLATLKDAKAVDRLLEHAKTLLVPFGRSKYHSPNEKSELLEIATTLRGLLPNTEDERAVTFLNQLRFNDDFSSSETELAFARIAPKTYLSAKLPPDFGYADRRIASAYAQGLGDIAASTDPALKLRAAEILTTYIAGMAKGVKPAYQAEMLKAVPELQRANAAFKPDNLKEILLGLLSNEDVAVRVTAAGLIGAQPASKENIDALRLALAKALVTDKASDDAQLAIMGALSRLDKKGSVGSFLVALNSPNYLVRKRAFDLLSDPELQKAFPGIPTSIENAKKNKKDQVLPYDPSFGTKLGQVLNTEADYRRALSRKNGTVKAVFTTQKGRFTIDFTPEEAPLTVDNFVRLARKGYFNGLEVHRVVPNFVMQDGDPSGDGNGGPGWSIRCEVNMLEYGRGAVGMALSGKDTGGSQWFVTHAPQPHLDGGYTVFGHVNETGMKVVDNIVRGDRIISVRIIESRFTTKAQWTQSKTR